MTETVYICALQDIVTGHYCYANVMLFNFHFNLNRHICLASAPLIGRHIQHWILSKLDCEILWVVRWTKVSVP